MFVGGSGRIRTGDYLVACDSIISKSGVNCQGEGCGKMEHNQGLEDGINRLMDRTGEITKRKIVGGVSFTETSPKK
jgi:hypothetical protein